MVKETKMKQTELGLIPENWDVKKLGSFCYITKLAGFEYSKYFNSYKNGGNIIVVRGTNITNNQLDLTDVKYIPEHISKFLVRSKLFKNDLVFAYVGTIGPIYLIEEDERFHLGPNTAKIRIDDNDVDSNFIHKYFLSGLIKKEIDDRISVGAQPSLSMSKIRDFSIICPPLAEQEAIATALSDCDSWIDSFEQVLAKKRLIKQGAMQELLTPKEDWEVKKLGEVLQFGSGRDYKHLKSGEIPVYGTGGVMTYVNQYLYNGESVGIGRKGTIDKPVFLQRKFWTVDTLFFTHSFNGVIPKYIYYQFLLIAWKEYNEASGVPSLNKNTLEQIEIKLPSLSEQTRIATILSDMDVEIEALEEKLQKARQIKQGMMQELLTGKTRILS